ncbi:hypothetical protein [Natranaeroarchaeum sulfidigenes]|uniref:Uncharacterized protein n=1 Tax=Natranaeroarchaeum sulfidigenes TaxID=2784880 RepID=A0A897N0N8_9EURY|nr:hypothetical protein [Natranaeroarchaeum sulfidigenes]QSG03916.1 hypothetical protein AArcS_2720 [Natranaeroarchaeum sulfidigenes]
MDWSAVGAWVDDHEELVRSVVAVTYIIAILLIGATLVGNPTSNYPIISDIAGLLLVFHAYRTGNMAALGSTILIVVAVGVWYLVAAPALPIVDVGALVPAGLPSEAVPPVTLATMLALGYMLTLTEVLPDLGQRVTERV